MELHRQQIPLVLNGFAIATGDIDGDGKVDLVFARNGQSAVLRSNGDGSFVDETSSRMPLDLGNTVAIQLGDIDGDNDLDLVLGNGHGFSLSTPEQNRVYRNDKGRFTDITTSVYPARNDVTVAILLVDIDRDNDLDIVVGNYQEQNRLLLNVGGKFTDVTSRLPQRNDPTWALVAGDIDGDKDIDIVVGNRDNTANAIYINNGIGFFSDAKTGQLPGFKDHTNSVALADIDSDNDLDLMVGNRCLGGERHRLLLNDGKGNFSDVSSRLPKESDWTNAVAFVDVDNDKDQDLLISTFFNTRPGETPRDRLFENDGKGNFKEVTSTRMPLESGATMGLAIADVDSDGRPDLITANVELEWSTPRAKLYPNDGKGGFYDATAPAAVLPARIDETDAFATGDFNGDGNLDVVFANRPSSKSSEQNRLCFGDGNGDFVDAPSGFLPADNQYSTSVAVGDVDGDGDLDIVVGNRRLVTSGQNRLYLGDGTGRFVDGTTGRLPAADDATTDLVLADVNRDGKLDLYVANDGQQDRLLLGNGKGTFTDQTAVRLPKRSDATVSVIAVDVDNDGDLDVIAGNRLNQPNRLFLNNGAGFFKEAPSGDLPAQNESTTDLAAGDLDGDGNVDLVATNGIPSIVPGRYPNRMFLGNGKGKFSDASLRLPANNAMSYAVCVGDFDGDGLLDIVTADRIDTSQLKPTVTLVQNLGKANFRDVTAQYLEDLTSHPSDDLNPLALGLVDVDHDGDQDLLIASLWRNRLFQNLSRQVHTSIDPHVGRTYQIDYYAGPGTATAPQVIVPLLGFAPLLPRLRIAPLGELGIHPSGLIALPQVTVPAVIGAAQVKVPTPNLSPLRGLKMYLQGLVLHSGSLQSWRLTNLDFAQIR